MLANISANCKIEPIKPLYPTSSKVIKGVFRQFEKNSVTKTAKSSVREKHIQGQAPPSACPCLSPRAESESRSPQQRTLAVERTDEKKGFIAEAAGPPKAGRRQRRRAEEQSDDAGGWTKGADEGACPPKRRTLCRRGATVFERGAGESFCNAERWSEAPSDGEQGGARLPALCGHCGRALRADVLNDVRFFLCNFIQSIR